MTIHSDSVPVLDREVTVADVMAVLRTALCSLRTERDPRLIEQRLDHADVLTRLDADPSQVFCSEVPEPLGALALFAASCQHANDLAVWEWAKDVFRNAGLDLVDVIDATAPFVRPHVKDCLDVPMAEFQVRPEYYEMVPLSDLPFAHNPFKCEHKNLHVVELQRLQRKEHRWRRIKALLGISGRSGHQIEVAAGEAVQRRILNGDLPECRKHISVDWEALNREAVRIQADIRPWTKTAVLAAVEHTAGLSDDERTVLRSLFTDPLRWDRKSISVGNGQHRICGLRAAHVKEAFVAVGPEAP